MKRQTWRTRQKITHEEYTLDWSQSNVDVQLSIFCTDHKPWNSPLPKFLFFNNGLCVPIPYTSYSKVVETNVSCDKKQRCYEATQWPALKITSSTLAICHPLACIIRSSFFFISLLYFYRYFVYFIVYIPRELFSCLVLQVCRFILSLYTGGQLVIMCLN